MKRSIIMMMIKGLMMICMCLNLFVFLFSFFWQHFEPSQFSFIYVPSSAAGVSINVYMAIWCLDLLHLLHFWIWFCIYSDKFRHGSDAEIAFVIKLETSIRFVFGSCIAVGGWKVRKETHSCIAGGTVGKQNNWWNRTIKNRKKNLSPTKNNKTRQNVRKTVHERARFPFRLQANLVVYVQLGRGIEVDRSLAHSQLTRNHFLNMKPTKIS